ncbi:AP3D [Lepeophtheirus salmonis]|uniref:AP3D n=1 Tax=Lepeophtheirus salmonis TaxID=72036 RepID=A0A7R8H4E6_LEPSM|nr:AP3D [Lepeophtheirus salmonis]CAF2858428.1 AP3D [Lepeophtheirus salmonis]
MSPDLARDLHSDILSLLTSTRPYVRKKAVLILYKVFLKYPDALRPSFPRLKEKLEDPDPGVQSAAVNVISDLEVQERASVVTQFVRYALKHLEKNESLLEELSIFTQGDLNPVAPKAQKKVPIPEGLDLDEWINEPLEDDSKSSSSLSSSDDEKVLFVPIGGFREKFQFQEKEKV